MNLREEMQRKKGPFLVYFRASKVSLKSPRPNNVVEHLHLITRMPQIREVESMKLVIRKTMMISLLSNVKKEFD